MGEVIETGGAFREVAGIAICFVCGDSHAALVPGSCKTNAVECRTCHEQNSAFISAAAIKAILAHE